MKLRTDPFTTPLRLTNRWSAAKGSTAYSYDQVGNLTNVAYPISSNLSFSYDPMNRLTQMVDGIGTTTFGYTSAGQLQSETGPWANDMISYTYSDRMRSGLDLQQLAGSDWLESYTYDLANRLNSVTSPAGTFDYAYNAGVAGHADSSSLVNRIDLPNTAFITNTYDANGRMLGTYLYNSGATDLDASVYTYNVGNQRASVVRTGENTVNYTYDLIGQVIADQASEVSGDVARKNEQLHYGFDAAGNLLHRTNNALVQNFAVNSVNELTTETNVGTLTVMGGTVPSAASVTVNGSNALLYGDGSFAATNMPVTTSYTAVASDGYGLTATNTVTVNTANNTAYLYDANGNLTNDGWRNFTYDDENELTQVWVSNQWMSQFNYDGKMRRRIRQEFTWLSGGWVQTNAVYYVYDGNLVIQERATNVAYPVAYSRGTDLSGKLEGAGGIGGLLARTAGSLVNPLTPSHAYYHSDGNGNISILINSSEVVVAQYVYDAFGNVLSKYGPLSDGNLYRFSSKETHLNSGLVYYLYRYYDAKLQRWLNRDPLGDGVLIANLSFRLAQALPSYKMPKVPPWELLEGPNLYEAVYNSPVDIVDTDGRGGFPHYNPFPEPEPPDQLPPGKYGNVCKSGPPGCSKSRCTAELEAAEFGVGLIPGVGWVGNGILAVFSHYFNKICDDCPNP